MFFEQLQLQNLYMIEVAPFHSIWHLCKVMAAVLLNLEQFMFGVVLIIVFLFFFNSFQIKSSRFGAAPCLLKELQIYFMWYLYVCGHYFVQMGLYKSTFYICSFGKLLLLCFLCFLSALRFEFDVIFISLITYPWLTV